MVARLDQRVVFTGLAELPDEPPRQLPQWIVCSGNILGHWQVGSRGGLARRQRRQPSARPFMPCGPAPGKRGPRIGLLRVTSGANPRPNQCKGAIFGAMPGS
jgi:hypothetical protein